MELKDTYSSWQTKGRDRESFAVVWKIEFWVRCWKSHPETDYARREQNQCNQYWNQSNDIKKRYSQKLNVKRQKDTGIDAIKQL